MSKVVGVRDTNSLGTLHGGVTLQMTEEAGYVESLFHLARVDFGPKVPVLCRIESTDFLSPGHRGELVFAKGRATFASARSLKVKVDVQGMGIGGEMRLISRSVVWFTPCSLVAEGGRKKLVAGDVPPPLTPWDDQEGERQYLHNKLNRERLKSSPKPRPEFPSASPFSNKGPVYSPEWSCSSTSFLSSVSDCNHEGLMPGGTLMKRVDEVSTAISVRYTGKPCMSARAEAADFMHPVFAGDFITIVGKVVFTGSRSLDVASSVYREDAASIGRPELVLTATFTCVSINGGSSVPPLQVQTDRERETFNQRLDIYNDRKKERAR